MKRKVTDKYRLEISTGTVAELPENLKPMADGIHALIQAVYDDSVLADMFSDGHETKVKENPLNENFHKKNFRLYGIKSTISTHIQYTSTALS